MMTTCLGGSSGPTLLGAAATGPTSADACDAEDVNSRCGGAGAPRQRDIFPLPVPTAAEPGGLAAGGRSRGMRRRARRAASAPWLVRQAVESLNGLSGAGCAAGSVPQAEASLAQQRCLSRIAESVSQLGPPPGDLQPLAALQELQAALSSDGSLSTRAEAVDISRLSLPPSGNRPVAL